MNLGMVKQNNPGNTVVDRAGGRGLDLFFVSPRLKSSRIVTRKDGNFRLGARVSTAAQRKNKRA